MSYNAANMGRNSCFVTEVKHKSKTVFEYNLLGPILMF